MFRIITSAGTCYKLRRYTEMGFMCRYDHGRVSGCFIFFFLSYVLFFVCYFGLFWCGNQHYSDIELGVVGAGTLLIVLWLRSSSCLFVIFGPFVFWQILCSCLFNQNPSWMLAFIHYHHDWDIPGCYNSARLTTVVSTRLSSVSKQASS